MNKLLLSIICSGLALTSVAAASTNIGDTPYLTGLSNGNVTICRWDGGSPTEIQGWGGFGNNLPSVPFNYLYGKNTIFGITNDGSCDTKEIKDWPQMHVSQKDKKMYLYKITLPDATVIEYMGQKLSNDYKIDSPAYQTYVNTLANKIWSLNQITSGKPASEVALATKLKSGFFKAGGTNLDSKFEIQAKGPISKGYTKIGECIVGTQSQYCNKVF